MFRISILNNKSIAINFFQQYESVVSEIIDPVLQTVSQDPRSMLAISGGFVVLAGVGIIKASNVPSTVRSWFWRNEKEEMRPRHWGMAVIGASSVCLGACAVAMAIFGFVDPKSNPVTFQEPLNQNLEEENQMAESDVEKEPQRGFSYRRLTYDFEPERCELMELVNQHPRDFSYLFKPG